MLQLRIMPQHSTPGVIMGTVGYMSPEQAQGKTKEIDQRSDIFSFGCILFEAATGKKPFEGDSIVNSLHSLIYEPAPPITDLILRHRLSCSASFDAVWQKTRRSATSRSKKLRSS